MSGDSCFVAMPVGDVVGFDDTGDDNVGKKVGVGVGFCVGESVGEIVGVIVGSSGGTVGLTVGLFVGFSVGLSVGASVGLLVGRRVGERVGACVGATVGDDVVGPIVGVEVSIMSTEVGSPVNSTIGSLVASIVVGGSVVRLFIIGDNNGDIAGASPGGSATAAGGPDVNVIQVSFELSCIFLCFFALYINSGCASFADDIFTIDSIICSVVTNAKHLLLGLLFIPLICILSACVMYVILLYFCMLL